MLCVGVGIAQFVIQFCLQTILHELGNGLLEQALDVLRTPPGEITSTGEIEQRFRLN